MAAPSRRSRRRVLLTAGVVLTAPFAIGQTTRRLPHVGIAFNSNSESAKPYLDAFVQGMEEHGYGIESAYRVEARYANGRNDQYPAIMGDLLRADCAVIVVGPNTGVQAARAATSTVPIVMAGATDPEVMGLVATLARPGGNVTGLALNSVGLYAKRLQLIRDILPKASHVAFLADPNAPGHALVTRGVGDIASALSFRLAIAGASNLQELDRELRTMAARRPDALLVSAAILFWTHRKRIVEFCAQQRIAAIYSYREPVADGGLIGYAANLSDTFRKAASYVARILRGTQPADLPVEQPTRIDLIVNLKTAKALAITIPQSLLLRADEVIQ